MPCKCHCCEDWDGSSNPIGTQYYKCNKCEYEYSDSESSGGYKLTMTSVYIFSS